MIYGLLTWNDQPKKSHLTIVQTKSNVKITKLPCAWFCLIFQCMDILRPIAKEDLKALNKTELLTLVEGEQSIRLQLEKQVEELQKKCEGVQEKIVEIEGKYVRLKTRLFSPSSEKLPASKPKPKKNKKSRGGRSNKPRRPSERYPNLPIQEVTIELETAPDCDLCGHSMSDSSMSEVNEFLTVTPKKYHIVRQFRKKYRCTCCHGSIITTPCPPRIVPKSSYSDEMILDAALSKFCDLIPVERYCAMANRSAKSDLPPNSLISLIHKLAQFLVEIYSVGLKNEILEAEVVHADETPHRMLEGDEKKNWYLWGFSSAETAYFEYHDSRSGDSASEILSQSKAEFLVTDAYSGYSKALRHVNSKRDAAIEPILKNPLCNAHCRRKFSEAKQFKESEYYLKLYRRIYRLEAFGKENPKKKGRARKIEGKIFKKMKERASVDLGHFSKHSGIAIAINYFLKNEAALTLYLSDTRIPIDNNPQERLLRSPVVGRKTWYGTHSRQGAETAAILFSLVESCKLNGLNPREYFDEMVKRIHEKKMWMTPKHYQVHLRGDTG